MSKHWD